jgi:hypothetical protein
MGKGGLDIGNEDGNQWCRVALRSAMADLSGNEKI